MKLYKRIITLAICTAIAVFSFSGCKTLSGNRCSHSGRCKREYDEQTHYLVCEDCGGKFDVNTHSLIMAYVNGRDTSQHFMKCQICKYTGSYEPHVLTEWVLGQSYGWRKCTTEDCKYEEICTHAGTTRYVVDVDGHYLTCDKCELHLTKSTAHTYDLYTDLTETTHSLICECGKVNGEILPHDFEYKCENDSHWQTCICDFTTEKVACSYGDYVPDPDMHYKVCSVCGGKSRAENHSYELTDSRKRLCRDCSVEKRPYSLLLGTWQYSTYGIKRITLFPDWSYTITNYSGTLIENGDYDVYYYQSLSGEIDGTIYLRPSEGYTNPSISFKFKKGVTNEFKDKNYHTYTKV